jgi:hypothetical protein
MTSASSQSQTSSSTISVRVSVITRSSCGFGFFLSSSSSTTAIIDPPATRRRVKFTLSALPGFALTICITWSNLTGPASIREKPARKDITQTADKNTLKFIFLIVRTPFERLERRKKMPFAVNWHSTDESNFWGYAKETNRFPGILHVGNCGFPLKSPQKT